jgi:hypothetical protein
LANRVSVTIGVMASSLVGFLAVESGDAPEVGGGNEEGGDPGGEESSEGSIGNDVLQVVMDKRERVGRKERNENEKERKGKERKGKERKGKERKGKERKGKERKGKERKGKEGKEREREGKGGIRYSRMFWHPELARIKLW